MPIYHLKNLVNSLAVQWLEICAVTAEGLGFNPWLGELRSHQPCGVTKKIKTLIRGFLVAGPEPWDP